MSGLDYLQSEPFERFRIPCDTNPLGAAAAVLSFAAYPHRSLLKRRREACDAFQAWIFRRAYQHGMKVRPPRRLNRHNLPPATVRSRVFKAARRFEWDGLDLAQIGMELSFQRSGAWREIARMLGAHFEATEVKISVPKHFGEETQIFRQYLSIRRAQSALTDEKTAIRDFKRRTWNLYLPALPLLIAIHNDILQYDSGTGNYGMELPGLGKRYLAISMLHNPDKWIHDVPRKTQLRRYVMEREFPEARFADILPENPVDDLRFAPEG